MRTTSKCRNYLYIISCESPSTVAIKIIVDDFRISHIFDIEDPVNERELSNVLRQNGFDVTYDRVITHPPIRAVILNMARRSNVQVLYQKESIPSYIGTSGKDMREVLNQFNSLNNIISSLDPTLHDRQSAVEMVLTTKVYGKDLPSNTIPSLCSQSATKYDALFNTPMNTHSVTLESKSNEVYYSLTLSPLYRSPRYYHIQLVNRDNDLKKVLEFTGRSEHIIRDAVELLEGK